MKILEIIIFALFLLFALSILGLVFSLVILEIKKYIPRVLKNERKNLTKLQKWTDELPEYSFIEYFRKNYFIDLWIFFLHLQTIVIPLHFIFLLFTNKRPITDEVITIYGSELLIYIPLLFYTYIKLLKLHEEKGFVKSHIVFTIMSMFYFITIYKEFNILFFGKATLVFIVALGILYLLSYIFLIPLEKNYIPYDWRTETEKLREEIRKEEERNIEHNYSKWDFSIFDTTFEMLTKYTKEQTLIYIADRIESYTDKCSNQDDTEENRLKLKQYKTLYELFSDEELYKSVKKIVQTKEIYKEHYIYEKMYREEY